MSFVNMLSFARWPWQIFHKACRALEKWYVLDRSSARTSLYRSRKSYYLAAWSLGLQVSPFGPMTNIYEGFLKIYEVLQNLKHLNHLQHIVSFPSPTVEASLPFRARSLCNQTRKLFQSMPGKSICIFPTLFSRSFRDLKCGNSSLVFPEAQYESLKISQTYLMIWKSHWKNQLPVPIQIGITKYEEGGGIKPSRTSHKLALRSFSVLTRSVWKISWQ